MLLAAQIVEDVVVTWRSYALDVARYVHCRLPRQRRYWVFFVHVQAGFAVSSCAYTCRRSTTHLLSCQMVMIGQHYRVLYRKFGERFVSVAVSDVLR